MQREYSTLSERLIAFYFIRITIVFCISAGLLFFINPLPALHSQIQIDTKQQSMIECLELEMQGALSALGMVANIVSASISSGSTTYKNDASTPCNSNITLCNQLQSQPDEYLSSNYFHTSNSIRCLNQCPSLAPFSTQLWLFKIRQPLIEYIVIKYTQLTNKPSIVYVPSLAKQDPDILSLAQLNQIGFLPVLSGFVYGAKKQNIFLWMKINTTFIQQSFNIPPSYITTRTIKNSINTPTNSTSPQIVCLPSLPEMCIILIKSQTYMDTIPILVFAILAIILLGVKSLLIARGFIKEWIHINFTRLQTIDQLYRFQINQMFQGRKPINSLVLQSSSIYEFYQHLSQMPNKQFSQVQAHIQQVEKIESFKFQPIIKQILNKYYAYIKPIFIEKNRQIINNKFFIQSSINEIVQCTSKRLKELQMKARELKLTQVFFKYAYLSLLLQINDFDQMLSADAFPLPEAIIVVFRYINRSVRGVEIRAAFKVADNLKAQTQEELQIRVQDNLLQKYLQIMKDMDIHSIYAKQLGLEKELGYLNDNIQNMRFLLTQHNKNIRLFSKPPS